ncbi:2-hydroxyacid dehydrogenase [Arthrobacter castelli]|uniref:2-hydroxyacid dehydrogenase n=1 Tax=Arthrobacter castelli TaxID=271431 RepID=UPI0003F83EBC|nr:2-hydroxyacid dehydrogenase [Arthrobacter castelli]
MASNASSIQTITFPDQRLLDAVQPLPEGMRGGIWDLQSEPDGVELGEVDAVILPYMGPKLLDQLSRVPHLKMVQTQTTGYDGIPEAVGEDVAVVSAAGVHADSTAEMAVALMLASLRGIDVAARDQVAARWNPQRWTSLADRKVLLVGVGGIGAGIAARLEPFGVELTRVGSTARDDAAGHVHGTDELVALARHTDVIVVITPLSEATHHLVNAGVLAAMPDGALVVNVARGAVVDSDALTAEVVSGRIRAAIDVFDPEPVPEDHPLWKAEGALITPHNAGNSSAFFPRVVRLLQSQLAAIASGGSPENLVRSGPFAADGR